MRAKQFLCFKNSRIMVEDLPSNCQICSIERPAGNDYFVFEYSGSPVQYFVKALARLLMRKLL